MSIFLNIVQVVAILITTVGIYILSRNEQNRMSMHLMLSMVGCLVMNCSYLLLMNSTTPPEAMAAVRMESIGNTLMFYFLQFFIMDYLKLHRARWIMPIWAAVEVVNFYCLWSDAALPLVYRSIRFEIHEGMGLMRAIREMGPVQFVRSIVIAAVMLGTLFYMLWRLFFGKILVRSEKNNLARLIGADSLIIGIMVYYMMFRQIFNVTPVVTAFAILTIIQGVIKGEMLNAADTGRHWMIEYMRNAFVLVDPAYGFLDANTAARRMFPQLRELPRNAVLDDALLQIFRGSEEIIYMNGRYYDKTLKTVTHNYEIVGCGMILTDVTEQQMLLKELDSARQRAEDANEAKSAFMSNMSHEIRTPMNAVVGMTEILLRSDLPEQERGYLQNIRNSGNALLSIVNDILDFSKIESHRMEIVEDDYEPLSLLHDLSMIFLNRIDTKPIELLYDIDPKLPAMLCGDALRVRQVIINLMNNAIKFTDDGYVKLSIVVTEMTEKRVTMKISVEDSGQGIREEDIPKLFGVYQQINTKKNHAKEGTGLGLAISRSLVELMGGEFSVESEYGVGSCFSFTLTQKRRSKAAAAARRDLSPEKSVTVGGCFASAYLTEMLQKLAESYGLRYIPEDSLTKEHLDYFFTDKCSLVSEQLRMQLLEQGTVRTLLQNPMMSCEPEMETNIVTKPLYTFNFCRILNGESGVADSQREEVLDFTASKASILVVDDNEMNLKVAIGLLAPTRMQIDTADNGRNALEKIRQKHYDLIFMDHMMPVMDGIEATRALRAMEGEYFKTVPVIALTANVVNEAKEQFKTAGMNDFAAKPIKMKEIAAVLKRWLPDEYIERAELPPEDESVEKLPVIEGLDTAEGVSNSGSIKLFVSLLGDFYHLIDMKSKKIEKCLADGLIRDYTIEVHALKNTARLIGATELSDEFRELERLGDAGDITALGEETGAVLEHYRSYKPILKPYAMAQQQEKQKVDNEEIITALRNLSESIDSFDLDGADAAMKRLDSYALPEALCEAVERLRALVADVAMEEVMELTAEMVDILTKQGD